MKNFVLFVVFVSASLTVLTNCDYWHNLTEEKTVTQTHFTLMIKDAWTRLPLPNTSCEDTSHHFFLTADVNGNITQEKATTDTYHFVCKQEGYFPREIEFTQGADAKTISIGLGRMGGSNWYPLDNTKKIGAFISGNTHVPTTFILNALPHDSNSSFRYIWTFSKHPELNHTATSPFADKPTYAPKLLSLADDTVFDTVTFVLRSHFPNIPDYNIDSVTIPIVWVKNQKPRIEILGSLRPGAKVGCADEDVFSILYQADDPDGVCKEVKLTNLDTNTYFGNLTLVQSCTDGSFKQGTFKIPLSTPWQKRLSLGMSETLFGTNHLSLSVKDDNDQISDTLITFTASPHFVPTLSIKKVATQAFTFTNAPVNFKVVADDSEATLARLIIDWGDSSANSNFDLSYLQIGHLEKNYVHTYIKPGDYFVHATLLNACGTQVTSTLPGIDYLHLQVNDPPRIALANPGYILKGGRPFYHFQLSVSDHDLEAEQDTDSIKVSWGDGQDSLWQASSTYLNKPWEHQYLSPAPGSIFSLHIRVWDLSGAIADTLLQVPAYQP